MSLTVSYPSSVNVGGFIRLSWLNTVDDNFYHLSKQINNETMWRATAYPPGSNQSIYGEQAESTWERVRYMVDGFPSGLRYTTGWITVVGGTAPDPGDPDPGDPDPGDPGPGDPDPGDPNQPPSVPFILTPSSLTPGANFTLNWNDSNGTTATYDIEESVNNGDYQRIATSWPHKSYDRFISTSWDTVQYMVRAKRDNLTSLWGYSGLITVETIFSPNMSVKVGDTVRTAKDGWVKVNGQLRRITDIWTKVNGQLKKS